MSVCVVPGKGRGLVATAPLSPGQLLLVVPPIALLEGELGDIPGKPSKLSSSSSSNAPAAVMGILPCLALAVSTAGPVAGITYVSTRSA
jgi:hypothetical protein